MTEDDVKRHTYPDRYRPGTHWATDIGWEILDRVEVGVVPEVIRAYLCGAIAGALMSVEAREHLKHLAGENGHLG